MREGLRRALEFIELVKRWDLVKNWVLGTKCVIFNLGYLGEPQRDATGQRAGGNARRTTTMLAILCRKVTQHLQVYTWALRGLRTSEKEQKNICTHTPNKTMPDPRTTHNAPNALGQDPTHDARRPCTHEFPRYSCDWLEFGQLLKTGRDMDIKTETK